MLLSKTPPTSERFLRGAKFYQLLDNFHFFFFNVTQSLNCWIIFSLFFFKCNIVLSETLEKGKCWPIVGSTCWKFQQVSVFSMEHVAPQSLFHCHFSTLLSHFRAKLLPAGFVWQKHSLNIGFKLSPNNPVVSW